MERILALDIGTVRIGVAVSDPMQIIATPVKVVLRREKSVEQINAIIREYAIKKIVIGLPYNMDGTLGAQAKDCINFAKNFENSCDIILEDERLTSFEAEESLKTMKKKYTKNKGLVDLQAACLILTQYLNRKQEKNG